MQKRILNDFENHVLIHRQVYTLMNNYLRDKNAKAITPQEYFPLSFDKEIKAKNDVPYATFWNILTETIKAKSNGH